MEALEISVEDGQTPVVISLKGRLDTTTAPQFQDAALGVVDQGTTDLTIDLKECSYVSSAGLRVIVTLQKRLIDGHLVFRNLSADVMEVLDMTGISKVITIE